MSSAGRCGAVEIAVWTLEERPKERVGAVRPFQVCQRGDGLGPRRERDQCTNQQSGAAANRRRSETTPEASRRRGRALDRALGQVLDRAKTKAHKAVCFSSIVVPTTRSTSRLCESEEKPLSRTCHFSREIYNNLHSDATPHDSGSLTCKFFHHFPAAKILIEYVHFLMVREGPGMREKSAVNTLLLAIVFLILIGSLPLAAQTNPVILPTGL